LLKATAAFAQTANVPSLWFYAANDSYFGPKLAASMAAAWNSAGGKASLVQLNAYAAEGHRIADDRAGWKLWGEMLDQSLQRYMSPNSVAAAQ
jgi:dienelactone hydrolase